MKYLWLLWSLSIISGIAYFWYSKRPRYPTGDLSPEQMLSSARDAIGLKLRNVDVGMRNTTSALSAIYLELNYYQTYGGWWKQNGVMLSPMFSDNRKLWFEFKVMKYYQGFDLVDTILRYCVLHIDGFNITMLENVEYIGRSYAGMTKLKLVMLPDTKQPDICIDICWADEIRKAYTSETFHLTNMQERLHKAYSISTDRVEQVFNDALARIESRK